jgi:hypothetical protein
MEAVCKWFPRDAKALGPSLAPSFCKRYPAPPGEKQKKISSTEIEFIANTYGGYTFDVAGGPNPSLAAAFSIPVKVSQIETTGDVGCTLPAAEQDVCKAIVHDFGERLHVAASRRKR